MSCVYILFSLPGKFRANILVSGFLAAKRCYALVAGCYILSVSSLVFFSELIH